MEVLGEGRVSRQGELPCEDVVLERAWGVHEPAGSPESVKRGEREVWPGGVRAVCRYW